MEQEAKRKKKSDQARQRLAALSKSSHEPMLKSKRIVPRVSSFSKGKESTMELIHKIYSSTRNPQSQNSAVLHLSELRGTAEDAHNFMDELQDQGHQLNGWYYETDEQQAEHERVQREQQQREARPWPEGKRYKDRWGRR